MALPTPAPAPRKTFTGPVLAALAALAALAVATVLVVLNNDDGDGGSGSAGSSSAPSSSSSSSSTSDEPSPSGADSTIEVASDDLGVSYHTAVAGYEPAYWAGPTDFPVGSLELTSAIAYESCVAEAGSDVLYGFVSSDDADLGSAATTVVTEAAKGVWQSGTQTTPTPAVEKTTDGGVTGWLTEISSTRTDGPDTCGTTALHLAAFAFDKDGQTIVMIASYRTDGDLVKPEDDLAQDVADTIKSLTMD